MKRYRCPHCGKKVFSPAHYSFMRFVSTKRMYAEFSPHSTSVLHCPSCTQLSAFFHHDNTCFNLELVTMLCALLTFIGVMVAMLYSGIIALFVAALLVVELCFMVYLKSHRSLMRMIKDNEYYKAVLPMSNCRVKVNSSKYLKPYQTYAIKMQDNPLDAELKATFPDELIPIQLYQSIHEPLIYSVHIMHLDKLPTDFIKAKSKFLIEDADGLFIAKGTVEELYL